MNKKLLFAFSSSLILWNCNSLQKQVVGHWKLTSTVESDNPYATRSSLQPQKVESKSTLSFKKDGTYASNAEYCFDGIKRDQPSSGKFYIKKHNKINKIFTLESSECPGIGSDLHFTIRDENLELQLPSVTGYRIQIFEKN